MMTDNELIAEFMRAFKPKAGHNYWSFINNIQFCEAIHTPDGEYIFYPNELKFDEYWDWLMPVVEKINILFDDGKLKRLDADIYRSMQDWILTVNIKNAFGDAVMIIKWYNEQKS